VHVDRATTWRHGEIDWNALIQYGDIPCDVDDSQLVGTPVEVSRQQLVMLLPKQKSKTGCKGYSRDALKKYVHELMEYHGDFSPDDKEWNRLPKLIARLEDEFGASRSILYKTVPAMVDGLEKVQKLQKLIPPNFPPAAVSEALKSRKSFPDISGISGRHGSRLSGPIAP
jgi:hypothetical protein